MNEDQRQHDYSETDLYPRPSHADLTYIWKYGLKASSGGGRSSARETIGRVAAGAIAEKYLAQVHSIEIVAFVSSVGKIPMPFLDGPGWMVGKNWSWVTGVSREEVDRSGPTRCPDPETAAKMKEVLYTPIYIVHTELTRLGYISKEASSFNCVFLE
jgi:chorismate synthase